MLNDNAENDIILAIDFNNVFYGSYYGEKLINDEGINVNAIRTFFFKMEQWLMIFEPKYVVFSRDLSRSKTFRRKLYKPYKAQRKPMDDDIRIQMKYTSMLLANLGYDFIDSLEYEADDVLGMVSKWGNENNKTIVIVSTDRDLYQLVGNNTVVFNPRDKEYIDEAWLRQKYGVIGNQWVELKMLQGDRSDNIPGIDGIGEVTALRLIQKYNNIDEVYKHLNQLKPKTAVLLENGQERLPLMRTLVTIETDYTKIGLNETLLCRKPPLMDEVYRLLAYLKIHSLFNVVPHIDELGGKIYDASKVSSEQGWVD